jgi:hypothetical protein
MQWSEAGAQGENFRAQALEQPGWYWVCRPLMTGEREYDGDSSIVLPVYVRGSTLHSPLTDLRSLAAADLAPRDSSSGHTFRTWYAGPVAPGAASGTLRVGAAADAPRPSAPGWYWARTTAPLLHVDENGIGPVYLYERGGQVWVYSASRPDGHPVDVFELGFAEPLLTAAGVIDGNGDAGRTQAEFFGPIAAPSEPPPPIGGA